MNPEAYGIDGYSPLGQFLTLLFVLGFIAASVGIFFLVYKGYKGLIEKHPEGTKSLQAVVKAVDGTAQVVADLVEQGAKEIKAATQGETFLVSPVSFKMVSPKRLPEAFGLVPLAVTSHPLRWKEKNKDQDALTFEYIWAYAPGSFLPGYEITTNMLIGLECIEGDEDGTLVTCRIEKLGPGEMLFSNLEEQAIQLTKNCLQGALQARYA